MLFNHIFVLKDLLIGKLSVMAYPKILFQPHCYINSLGQNVDGTIFNFDLDDTVIYRAN